MDGMQLRNALLFFGSGFVPFSAIYIELHYLLASLWGHQICMYFSGTSTGSQTQSYCTNRKATYTTINVLSDTMFGILFLTFLLLTVVVGFVTIAATYMQLIGEDHRWHWRSVWNGGAIGCILYLYSCYYYQYRSEMSGMLQGTFFFGTMAIISYALAIMLGAVGFLSSKTFVRTIYTSEQAAHSD